MAQIKTIKGNYKGGDHRLSYSSCGMIIDPSQTYLWIGDVGHDYTTLSPYFNTPPNGLNALGGDLTFSAGKTLLNNKPGAYCAHGNKGVPVESVFPDNWLHPSSYLYMMDSSDRIASGGSLKSFLDDSGARITIFDDGGAWAIVEGSLASPTATDSKAMPTLNSYITYYKIIAVDTSNKTLYLRGQGDYTYSTHRVSGSTHYYSETWTHNVYVTRLYKVAYTTKGDNGALSLGTPAVISLAYGGQGHLMDSNPIFYAGQNNASESCFVMMVENTKTAVSDSLGASAAGEIDYGYYTKASHNILFYKYAAGTSTLTTLADLDLLVGNTKPFCYYTPSRFVASPIAGEDDIYYAFTPAFDSTSTLHIIYLRWDKANDSLTAGDCTLDLGANVISDYLTYNVTSPACRLNMALTLSGGVYTLNVFYTHGVSGILSANTLATQRNLLTLTIDDTTFTDLTYLTHATIPMLSYAPQNVNETRLLVIAENEVGVYDWVANAWSKTASESGFFTGVTFDDRGRYWGVSVNSAAISTTANNADYLSTSEKQYSLSVNVISSALPNLVSCVWQDSGNFTFSGVNLSKNLVLNAYDENGDRVLTSVDLLITGSATFTSNGTKTLTLQTSAGADTLVPVTISGAGQVSVSASFAL
jgi:hypothetical protein